MGPEGIWGATSNNLVPTQYAEEFDRKLAGQQEIKRISDQDNSWDTNNWKKKSSGFGTSLCHQ